jgi:glycosyltransferase involved in cell wall biosynthesis
MATSRTRPLRVVHAPFNTPYARKTRPRGISIVNGIANVPDLASIEWAAEAANSPSYDICHLHFFELTPATVLRDCVRRCKALGKSIVATLHDVIPIHGCDPGEYREKIRVLVSEADAMVTLTAGAARALALEGHRAVIELPLGCVVDPTHPRWGCASHDRGPVRFTAFGSLRGNRRIDLLVRAFERLPIEIDATLKLLVRPIRTTTERDLDELRRYESRQVSVRVQHEISDDEVIDLVADSDVLVLPYDGVCHSGQLELAFDMGVGVVAPRAGHLPEQWHLSQGFVATPTWFEWTEHQASAERVATLADALCTAYGAACSVATSGHERTEAYRRHRGTELAGFLDSYERIYHGLERGGSC